MDWSMTLNMSTGAVYAVCITGIFLISAIIFSLKK